MKIFIGSKNQDKIREIADIMKGYEIVTCNDIANVPEVVEDCETIEGNAIKKAVETAKFTGMLTLADDTGLFVRTLCRRPGVYSARYAGENCSYKDNRDKMLREMSGKVDRYAEFQTVVALASPEGLIYKTLGVVPGSITEKETGDKGFGYDSIFEVAMTNRTYAQMSDEEKNKISHRAKAFNLMKIELDKRKGELDAE